MKQNVCPNCGTNIGKRSTMCFACRMNGDKNPAWKGGKKKTSRGYILKYCPEHPWANKDGYVYEHRLVMETHLRRYLEPYEVIHHKNGIKHDNRINNLELFGSNIEHQIYHGLLSPLRKSPQKRNVVLLIPIYGYVPAQSAYSIFNLVYDSLEYYNINYFIQQDLYIPLARCRLFNNVKELIKSGDQIDAIFCLDGDHYFQTNDFINLVERFCNSDYDVLGAYYVYKDETKRPVIFKINEDESIECIDNLKPNQGIIQVDCIGLGFCCVKPNFLLKMLDTYGPWVAMDYVDLEKNKYNGEDVAFFKRAKKIGAKVGVDTDTYVKHVGAAV